MIQDLEIQRRNSKNYQDIKEYSKLKRFLESLRDNTNRK